MSDLFVLEKQRKSRVKLCKNLRKCFKGKIKINELKLRKMNFKCFSKGFSFLRIKMLLNILFWQCFLFVPRKIFCRRYKSSFQFSSV